MNLSLKSVDLTKAKEHECPGIKEDDDTTYLVRIDGNYYIGSFYRMWYGLNFSGGSPTGVQFDAPGWNSSTWEGVWEIVETEQ